MSEVPLYLNRCVVEFAPVTFGRVNEYSIPRTRERERTCGNFVEKQGFIVFLLQASSGELSPWYTRCPVSSTVRLNRGTSLLVSKQDHR
jgi:hypothetical protein